MSDDAILQHFGVLGMKWGKRKGGSTASEDHGPVSNVKGKKASELSNAELKAAVARIKLEKEYKDLTKKDLSPGAKWVSGILGNYAKTTISNYLASKLSIPVIAKTLSDVIKK